MMPAKKYKVTLTEDERNTLTRLISTGKAAARKLTHARILLNADASEGQPGWTDKQISEALHVSPRTIERAREALVQEGLEAALNRKNPARTRPPKLDGEKEAHLIALACSTPPEGRERWTMQLLADKIVELNIIESISDETIRLRLKKTKSNLG
jgi:transposase